MTFITQFYYNFSLKVQQSMIKYSAEMYPYLRILLRVMLTFLKMIQLPSSGNNLRAIWISGISGDKQKHLLATARLFLMGFSEKMSTYAILFAISMLRGGIK